MEKVRILIVDDRPDKLLALEAVLAELDTEVTSVRSGREALRQLLQTEFAVILMDINMPEMDGFETAALIRQRGRYKHTPIIFLTAADHEMHVLRSYSLGAVDYILTPVRPEVLRAKVGVFVELARKNQEVALQAESLRRRAAQLQKLASASVSINSAPLSLERKLTLVAETAREVIGAQQAIVTVWVKAPRRRKPQQFCTWSFSNEYAAWQARGPGGEALRTLRVLRDGRALVRLSEVELRRHLGDAASSEGMVSDCLPWRGVLAVHLLDANGSRIGVVEVSHKTEGEFSEDDEAILVQLAQLASVALQNWLNEGTREANRIKDEFLGILSHELRTPLHAILGWTQHLRVEAEKDSEVARALDVIERNVNAQTALVEDLLDVSRITSGKLHIEKRPLSLHALLADVVDACKPQAEVKKLALEAKFHECASEMVGDVNRLRQVFSNLLSNAIKFTASGGKISVEVCEASVGELASELRGQELPGQFEIRICDSGEGISPEFLPYIFERFRQGKTSGGRAPTGLGLGLAIVRHIVELHGGQVEAESPGLGQGTTFIVKIPRNGGPEPIVERETPASVIGLAAPVLTS